MTEELEDVMNGVNEVDAKYDAICKSIFQHKEVIAVILKYVVSEFQGKTIPEIIRWLNGIEFVKQPLNDNISKSNIIKQDNVEFSSMTEKRLFFDILFQVRNPAIKKSKLGINLHIDLEFQNDYNVEYSIAQRGLYYAARELGHQLNYVDGNTNYKSLEKVYSIWICRENIPKREQNSIIEYNVQPKLIYGDCYDFKKKEYDLIDIVVIKLGEKKTTEYDNGILRFLEGVFQTDIKRMEEYINVSDNESLKKDVVEMKGYMTHLLIEERYYNPEKNH